MNKLIKEFAEQAGAVRQCSEKCHDSVLFTEYELEKFAELVVKECIKQARKDENGLAYEAVGRIAEHFGIFWRDRSRGSK